MNKTEILAFNWLKEKGYKEKDIIFFIRKTPDFICNDGKRYEAKFLYGNRLLFSKSQIPSLKDNDSIIVFDRNKFVSEFKWKDREKTIFKIEIINYLEGTDTIRISSEIKKILDDIKIHPRETYQDIIERLIKKENGKT